MFHTDSARDYLQPVEYPQEVPSAYESLGQLPSPTNTYQRIVPPRTSQGIIHIILRTYQSNTTTTSDCQTPSGQIP